MPVAASSAPAYKRVLLKLSGEALLGDQTYGIDPAVATQVAKDPRIHLVGYGPSASTIGANRAGAAAASELMAFLGLT